MSTCGEIGTPARVQCEDLGAPMDVGDIDDDLAVEAPGPQQRVVEDVGAVGRGHDHDARLALEPVHLDEHLVERLLALVVALAHAGAALAAHGVELVDEDDRRRLLARLAEEVAHARGADADERLDELRAGEREEVGGASPATARASSVLPVPGGPTSSTPFGARAPSCA